MNTEIEAALSQTSSSLAEQVAELNMSVKYTLVTLKAEVFPGINRKAPSPLYFLALHMEGFPIHNFKSEHLPFPLALMQVNIYLSRRIRIAGKTLVAFNLQKCLKKGR